MKIELHTITACGFYQRGCKTPLFGVASEWLGDFLQWINQRINIVATKTFDPPDGEAEIYCTFCIGDGQQQGVGIALWHGVPATESGVAYINRGAQPGLATASEQALPHGSIAGWPSYYWILPKRNQIVSLQPAGRIRNRGSGFPALRNYLKSYLETYSPYAETTPINSNDHDSDPLTIPVQGWRATPNAPLHSDVSVRFQTVSLNQPSMRDAILTRWQDVRKRIHSVQVTRSVVEDRNALQDALALLGWDDYQPPDQDRLAFRWECDWQPTHAELDALILQVAEHGLADNRNERIGICFTRDSRTYWLDQEPVQASIDLPDKLETALDWGPNELRKAWSKAQEWVMARPYEDHL